MFIPKPFLQAVYELGVQYPNFENIHKQRENIENEL